jgi:hypothetical protein
VRAIDVDEDAMATPAKSKLEVLLAGQPVGTWVILDPGMSKVLGAAKTPEAAMRKARLAPGLSGGPGSKRPVMMQIPDPTIACVF